MVWHILVHGCQYAEVAPILNNAGERPNRWAPGFFRFFRFFGSFSEALILAISLHLSASLCTGKVNLISRPTGEREVRCSGGGRFACRSDGRDLCRQRRGGDDVGGQGSNWARSHRKYSL